MKKKSKPFFLCSNWLVSAPSCYNIVVHLSFTKTNKVVCGKDCATCENQFYLVRNIKSCEYKDVLGPEL